MKRLLISAALLLMSVASYADAPLKENDYSWMENIRTEHPRVFLTKDDLPQIRKAAFSYERSTYDAMKERVDAEYAQGRNTVMSDLELESILKDIDYDFYKKLEHINMHKNYID